MSPATIQALKALLKCALRRFGFRCVACRPLDGDSVQLDLVRNQKPKHQKENYEYTSNQQ